MVYCCVPRCPSGRRYDSSVTFHSFPSNPDMAAKWIRNINLFIPNGGTWFPQTGNVVCSKHFLQSDFKPEVKTPTLKPRSVPTVFEKAVSFNPALVATSGIKRKKMEPKSPLIVKVIKPAEDIEDEHMDDAPLSELLRENFSASTSFSTLSHPLTTSVMPSSTSSLCISQITSLAESRTIPQQLQNSYIPNNSVFTFAEARNTVTPKPKNVTAEAEHVPIAEDKNINRAADVNDFTLCTTKPKDPVVKKPKPLPVRPKKKESSTDLIEIGPSTFLKINPDVIKVTKKITPSGNTVLQFVMNPNLGLDPKNIFQPVIKHSSSGTGARPSQNISSSDANMQKSTESYNDGDGHDLTVSENDSMVPDTTSPNDEILSLPNHARMAPVVLSTNLPVSPSFGLSMQQRHTSIIRQKNRQIHTLKAKVDKLLKKIDELENKCIVQERQLDFSCLKKLRAIKKNSDKGEPHANFILEQIRGYVGHIPLRWSDTTMTQCSVWCRKAPYAYEYFKKADLFRLPCIGTVKRYMKKHPEITTQIRNRTLGVHSLDSDDSSSDFDFDEDDDLPQDEDSMNVSSQIPCETVLTVQSNYQNEDSQAVNMIIPDSPPKSGESSLTVSGSTSFVLTGTTQSIAAIQSLNEADTAISSGNSNDASSQHDEKNEDEEASQTSESQVETATSANNFVSSKENVVKTITDDEIKSIYLPANQEGHITTMNLNGQEIILQPGNIIHLNSDLGGEGIESQYFVIPAADDQSNGGDHQYSVAQPLSFVIQNGDNEEVIYITEDTSDASETIVTSLNN